VTDPGPLFAAARGALEAAYGLALEGLADDQIQMAVYAAGASGMADPRDPTYLARVIDRLPIDESWLFRDDGLWEWLRDDAAPRLLERAAEVGRPVRALSLGCSAGQEPFSVAMLFQELLERAGIPPSAASTYAQVVGVDSSPARIEAARAGGVPSWSVQRCRPEWLRGRVTADPAMLGRYLVAPSVQAMCRFEVGNLVEIAARGNAALGGYDLVLCRNVLIYFRAAEAERLAGELARGLDAGAHLIFSAAEAHLLAAGGLELAGHLGAGRSTPRPALPPRRRRTARARRTRDAFPARPAPAAPARAAPARAPQPESRDAAVDAHVHRAIVLADAGRREEALREVRAALFHDPRHLYSRLLLGQHLIPIDAARARQVLRELLDAAARLSPDEAVPGADGLSVGQLAAAARILLARREDV
jgi:chemotaxis methyl-accepting protein methylase